MYTYTHTYIHTHVYGTLNDTFTHRMCSSRCLTTFCLSYVSYLFFLLFIYWFNVQVVPQYHRQQFTVLGSRLSSADGVSLVCFRPFRPFDWARIGCTTHQSWVRDSEQQGLHENHSVGLWPFDIHLCRRRVVARCAFTLGIETGEHWFGGPGSPVSGMLCLFSCFLIIF